ncbi:MAG: hypothetical protein ABR543_10900 [Gemmatimonadaceae bacterium]
MFTVSGKGHDEYFNIICDKCNGLVQVKSSGWHGGVPEVEMTCTTCKTRAQFKVPLKQWIGEPL